MKKKTKRQTFAGLHLYSVNDNYWVLTRRKSLADAVKKAGRVVDVVEGVRYCGFIDA